MASYSPAATANGSESGHPFHRSDGPTHKTLRGLNKPKCIVCGNVARSRCPYQSCKNCCFKAQNPCHIHVLKANATFPDKTPPSSTPLFDQQSTELTPAVSSLRHASLRQLSSNFSQFNNLQTQFRSKKPLTTKEATAINEWRFSKLKEYKDRNIEVENEAFDRYMQNVNLLEELFSAKSILEGVSADGYNPDCSSAEDSPEKIIRGQKLKLQSNPIRRENVRKRIQQIVDEGLKKLRKLEFDSSSYEKEQVNELPKRAEDTLTGKTSALDDLIDKLNKVQNEEDLKSCLELKAQLFENQTKLAQIKTEDAEVCDQPTTRGSEVGQKELDYLSQKLFRSVEIDQEALSKIDAHFSSLEKIEVL